MTTFTTSSQHFMISSLPNNPPRRGSDGLVFGVDAFGILLLSFNETTPDAHGVIGPVMYNTNTGNTRVLWTCYVDGTDFWVNIPTPVGTGAVRGVPFLAADNVTVHYITCTQTPPV